jgi:hypothetical protein
MKIELNQEVIVVGARNSARYATPIHKATVSKIGRKWFYLDIPEAYYVARDNKFSLEDGLCDGKGYYPEWQAFESEDAYKEVIEKPNLKNEIERSLRGLTYKQLVQVYSLINSFSREI